VDAPEFDGSGHFGAMAVIRLALSNEEKHDADGNAPIRGGTTKNHLAKAGRYE